MRLLAVTLGLMPLILIEVGMRVFDQGVNEAVDHNPLVNLEQLRPLFQRDDSGNQWIIPGERMNFFRPASFPVTKAKGTKRIFVLGGSTVQGRPYATETAFSTWLQLRLQAASPETRFEVINCGGVSYASYRVAKILEEVLSHQPDAIVLYTGHNEFLEDRTYADARSMGQARQWATRVGSKLRTVRWLREKLTTTKIQPTELSGEVDAMLDHPGGLAGYQRDTAWRTGVEEHFAVALRAMVESTQRSGVPLILCLPAGDLVNTPPIKTTGLESLDIDQLSKFDAAWERATDQSLNQSVRLKACEDCLAIDPEHAGAHYVAGRLQYERGNSRKALVHLGAARDHDVCPLRATSAIVATVREIATENNLTCVDTNTLLDQRDASGARISDGVVDPEFFVDHVHPTIAGHQLIAAEIATKIQTLGWFAASDQSERDYAKLVSEHQATLGEAYYARGKQRLQGLRLWATGRAGKIGID